MVESLPVTSGALQGVIVLDYPTAAPWDRIHIVYDGTNGQLPNLDLFNTAVHIAGNQMGVRTSLQELHGHTDSYEDRLRTMLRGMVNQGLGHATGPHSVFIPYHIDAITLQVSGFGNHDEVTMGRIVESLFRSLNNLLEHFHQSFFFYLLLGSKKFVSIGTYLPSAMLIAVNFTIMAIGLWLKSGTKPKTVDAAVAITEKPSDEKNEKKDTEEKEKKDTTSDSSPLPPSAPTESPRPLLLPLLFLLLTHTLSTIPLLLFNTLPHTLLCPAFTIFSLLSLCLPLLLSFTLHLFSPTPQVYTLLRCFSLLSLGLFLSALATLNFSLSFLIGLGAVPVTFIKPTKCKLVAVLQHLVLAVANPMVALVGVAVYMGEPLGTVLGEAQVGWEINGLWTAVVVWGVWWPAWVVAGVGAWGGGRMVEN